MVRYYPSKIYFQEQNGVTFEGTQTRPQKADSERKNHCQRRIARLEIVRNGIVPENKKTKRYVKTMIMINKGDCRYCGSDCEGEHSFSNERDFINICDDCLNNNLSEKDLEEYNKQAVIYEDELDNLTGFKESTQKTGERNGSTK